MFAFSGKGTTVIVVNPFDDDIAVTAGAAFACRYDGAGWNEERKLIGSSCGPR